MSDAARRIRETLINGSTYLDEVNRERDRYLAGLIDVDELERRIAAILAEREARRA